MIAGYVIFSVAVLVVFNIVSINKMKKNKQKQ
jgi:hypothetical protein